MTNGSSWLAAFTAFGACVGLLTGIFTLWDRYARGRPIAFLVFGPGARLFLSNPSDYSIFILSTKVTPNVFFLSRGTDLRTIIEDQLSDTINYWLIEPKGSAEFPIVDRYKDDVPLGLKDQQVRVSVNWRRGSTTWLPQIPLTVRTRTSTINKMRDPRAAREGE